MRKTILILSTVVLTLALSAADVFAQRVRVGVGRGGIGIGVGRGGGYYGSNYYGGRGYYDNYGRAGYWPRTYSYYSTPNYSYSEPATTYVPQVRQSYYNDPNVANITVFVPTPDAQVWFDDSPTMMRGMERTFTSPPLQSGSFTYSIRAQWNDNGRNVDQTRTIRVQAGQNVTVDFRRAADNLPLPKNIGE